MAGMLIRGTSVAMNNQTSASSAHHLPHHLTIDDLREQVFRCGRSKMYELLGDEDLNIPGPVLIIGRDRLWSRDEVLDWVACHRPAEHNPHRATIIEQTRHRRSADDVPASCHDKAPHSPSAVLAGFTPASMARRAV